MISSHRLCDVFEMLRSKILAGNVHLARNLIVDLRRNTDAARLGDALQTRRNVHAVAVDSGFVMDDVTLVDTDPELHTTRVFDVVVALRHGLLDGNRTLHGVHDAAKLSEDPVACRIDDAATVLPNDREDDGLVPFEIANGGSLVSAHQGAIARDVRSQDRNQFTGNPWISRNIRHPRGNHFESLEMRLAQLRSKSASARLSRSHVPGTYSPAKDGYCQNGRPIAVLRPRRES